MYMGTIVGIDLGTTNSLCAIFANGAPKLIPNAHGDVLTPSVVGILDDGQFVVGAAARELRVTRPQRCASRFKRWMGTPTKVPVAGESFSPTELSSLVLKSLKHDAEQFLGHEVDEAVITVPAYFNDNRRKATRAAGELAGFKVRRIINEPTAAALTYGFHDRTVERHFLVIDLGGGTFDVTLMEVFNGDFGDHRDRWRVLFRRRGFYGSTGWSGAQGGRHPAGNGGIERASARCSLAANLRSRQARARRFRGILGRLAGQARSGGREIQDRSNFATGICRVGCAAGGAIERSHRQGTARRRPGTRRRRRSDSRGRRDTDGSRPGFCPRLLWQGTADRRSIPTKSSHLAPRSKLR